MTLDDEKDVKAFAGVAEGAATAHRPDADYLVNLKSCSVRRPIARGGGRSQFG